MFLLPTHSDEEPVVFTIFQEFHLMCCQGGIVFGTI